MAAASSTAMAAFTFTNGDLILGFQTTGVGSDKNVYFNLGSGTGLRDNGNQGLLGNVGTALSSAFGPTWYSRSDIYFGVIGNLNSGPTSGFGAINPVNGDASRTHYISAAAAAPGTGTLRPANGPIAGGLGSSGNLVSSMETSFNDILAVQTAGNTLTVDQQDAPGAWSQGWSVRNPVPGNAFSLFTGGIQQNFGKATPSTYADVQRVVATNTGLNGFPVIPGVIGGGTYEFTVAIGSNGSISAVPETSSSLLVGAIGIFAAFNRRRRQTLA